MCGRERERSLCAEEERIPLAARTLRDGTGPGGDFGPCPADGDERYRLLVEDLPVLVLEMLPGGAVSYANAAASEFFGFPAVRPGGGRPEASFCVRHLEAICGLLDSVTPGSPLASLTSRVDFGGCTHWIEWSVRGAFGDGDARRFLVAGFDITEKKCREERLLESREVALAANEAQSDFMANMSHEIRTPLNGVMGMLQLLRDSDLAPDQAEFAETAVESCGRLARLLSDILDLSRAEARKLPLAEKPFSLRGMIGDVCSLFNPVANQGRVRLSCSVDASLPDSLLGDRLRVQQVLDNLVGNALKFTDSGEVRVEVLRQSASGQGPFRVLFLVSDTGIGVPDAKVESLFRPFTQVSTGFARLFEGAGLGLAICRRLVELMDGNIAIDSEEGVGTTVAVSLPLPPSGEDSPGEDEEGREQRFPPPGLRVLVAEDDYVNSYSVRIMLERAGHSVRTAENGREAVRLLSEQVFDVVLMDIQMPEMGGVEAAEAIRRGDAGAGRAMVPIVAMTAYAMPGDRERLLDSGMDGYVSKPVGKGDLLTAMARAVAPGRGATDRTAAEPVADGPPGDGEQRAAPPPGPEPSTRFAPARRSPQDQVECDFHEVSGNSRSAYFDFFPLPLLVLNDNRQVVFANRASLRLLGLSDVRDFLGRRPGEAIQCVYSGLEPGGCGTSRFCRECGIVLAFLQCMESEGPSTHDSLILQSADGKYRAKDFRVHAVPFDLGSARFYVITIQDISDLKQRELLERTFFHDVLNTAGSARNLVEMLEGGEDDLLETRDLLGAALNGLVDEISSHRDLFLAERGDYPACESRIMSGKMLGDVVREMLSQPLAEGRAIVVSPDSEDRPVWADRALLRRVLVNMLKNGLEATDFGGTVRAGCFGVDGYAVFEVRNDRVMPEETRLQVFKRFYSTKGRGRGVGTYSIKLLTENYLGGRAWFESDERVGTVFRVAIPELAE